MYRHAAALVAAAGLVAIMAGCDGDDDGAVVPEPTGLTSATSATSPDTGSEFPDVIDAVATYDEGTDWWTFDVTISSPYDSPQRYADGWRVVGPDGSVFGVHTLAHDHANEQPFTRRQTGVTIPDGVGEVTIEGRDQANGFGGGSVTISLQTE
jgi:hypothetical protein